MRSVCFVLVFCIAAVMVSSAQTFMSVASFDFTNGSAPSNPLVQATNGNLYGTTNQGGANSTSGGTVFEYDPSTSELTSLYSFCSETNCADGFRPNGGLVQATNGNLYGTTSYGGVNCQEQLGCGTIFEVTATGAVNTIYSFCSQPNCTDGRYPMAGLVQASNGNLYGTTYKGGNAGVGTVFEITPAGTLTTRYSFCSQANCTDGEYPVTPLIQAASGLLYGTTAWGGTSNDGTAFRITEKGKFTTLHSFDGADGRLLEAGLVQATNKKFYGTAVYGGANGEGTVFEMTAAGKVTPLYSFCSQTNCADGETPQAGLVQGANGDLYGTTALGGVNVSEQFCSGTTCGTIFEITSTGKFKFTSLYSFCSQANCADGVTPQAAMVQATDGSLYGTTSSGGAYGPGSLFSLSF